MMFIKCQRRILVNELYFKFWQELNLANDRKNLFWRELNLANFRVFYSVVILHCQITFQRYLIATKLASKLENPELLSEIVNFWGISLLFEKNHALYGNDFYAEVFYLVPGVI